MCGEDRGRKEGRKEGERQTLAPLVGESLHSQSCRKMPGAPTVGESPIRSSVSRAVGPLVGELESWQGGR